MKLIFWFHEFFCLDFFKFSGPLRDTTYILTVFFNGVCCQIKSGGQLFNGFSAQFLPSIVIFIISTVTNFDGFFNHMFSWGGPTCTGHSQNNKIEKYISDFRPRFRSNIHYMCVSYIVCIASTPAAALRRFWNKAMCLYVEL